MQIKQKFPGPLLALKCDQHHLPALIRLICAVLIVTPSWAASVYRCGNTYSASTVCPHGDAVEITPNAEPQSNGPRKTTVSSHDSQEADALERKRLNAENRASRQNATRVIVTTPNKTADTDTVPATEPHSNSHRRQLKSPYFTAKDPNSPPKKKGKATSLPPATN
jgi:hypothetical protein